MNAHALQLSSELATELSRPSPRLYDIVQALEQVDELLEANGGELTEDIETLLATLGGSLADKVDGICGLRADLIAKSKAARDEAKRLEERAESFGRRAESLRTFLLGAFVRLDQDKVKTARFTVWRQASPVSIRWTRNLDELPDDFRRVRIEPDISAAQAALKAGEELPTGFDVVTGRQHLRIT